MPYLIDGHNLIPKIPGMMLEDIDDENQLLELLIRFCRSQGKQAEVFFDNAPPGGLRVHNHGLVVARFVRQGTSADEAIRGRLKRLGRAARNCTVVSSDQEIQVEARAARAHYLSSESFANLLLKTLDGIHEDKENHDKNIKKHDEKLMDPDELDDWLRLFNSKDRD